MEQRGSIVTGTLKHRIVVSIDLSKESARYFYAKCTEVIPYKQGAVPSSTPCSLR